MTPVAAFGAEMSSFDDPTPQHICLMTKTVAGNYLDNSVSGVGNSMIVSYFLTGCSLDHQQRHSRQLSLNLSFLGKSDDMSRFFSFLKLTGGSMFKP
jgi:hypothetical protein